MAINFVKSDDIRILRDIEQYYSTQIDEMPMNGKMRRPDITFLCFTVDTALLPTAWSSRKCDSQKSIIV